MQKSVRTLMLFAATLAAQTDRGTITGSVTDIGGSFIAGVSILATHLDTNTQFKALSTRAGEFNLQSLPVGVYRVAIEHPGFKTAIHERVTLEAGSTARLETKLEIGAVQQSIQVT